MANHALVFMEQGIGKKWTPPVAYYFVHKTCPSHMPKLLMCDVVKALQEAGLNVLATVSDQGAVADINTPSLPVQVLTKPRLRKLESRPACRGRNIRGHVYVYQHYKRHEWAPAESLALLHKANLRFAYPQPTHPTGPALRLASLLLEDMGLKAKVIRHTNIFLPQTNTPIRQRKWRKAKGPTQNKKRKVDEGEVPDEENRSAEEGAEEEEEGEEESQDEDDDD